MRKQVATKLEKLEKQGKVNGPTPWVSPLVIIPKKNGDIRLCVDMQIPNMALRRVFFVAKLLFEDSSGLCDDNRLKLRTSRMASGSLRCT